MSEPLHRIVLIEHYIDVKNSLEIQPYGWIYKIEFPNGKVYIGQTTCLEDRKTTHISCANNDNKRFLVYKALRKYNMIETFELVVIDTADNKRKGKLCDIFETLKSFAPLSNDFRLKYH